MVGVLERAPDEALEKTLALIKPDAVRSAHARDIMHLIELNGFTILVQQQFQLTSQRAEEFYGEHKGKQFFDKLVTFMTSGPLYALVLGKPDAVKSWRTLMGSTNSFVAKAEDPRCIRALFGTDGTQNATHGSDSPASARREIKFFFPKLVVEPMPSSEEAQRYIVQQLEPTLLRALTALAKEKPSANRLEGAAFLGRWLLDHNPNKPRVVAPDQFALDPEQEDDEAEFDERLDADSGSWVEPPREQEVQPWPFGAPAEMPVIPPRSTADHNTAEAPQPTEGGWAGAAEAHQTDREPTSIASQHLDNTENDAAIKLQAAYRGHRVREHMKDESLESSAAV